MEKRSSKWVVLMKGKRRIFQVIHYAKFLAAKLIVFLDGNKAKDIWLIGERGFDARDNGYVFYCYMKEHHPEVRCKYVIARDSFDLHRIDKRDIVWHKSFRNYIYFATAKALISTHTYGYSPEMRLFENIERFGLAKVKGIKVYLTHYLSFIGEFNFKQRYLDLYTCTSKKDQEYILGVGPYGEDVVRLTGTPRVDNLYAHKDDPKENIILVMPTWRQAVRNQTENEFLRDIYYQTFQALLDDRRVIRWLEEINYKLIFYPHIEMQRFIHCFHSRSDRVIIGDATKFVVEDLLLRAKELITDYSSVFFDFALLSKKVIYFQFEKPAATRPDFSFQGGFGPIFTTRETLIAYLISQRSFELEELYQKRIREYFPLFDGDNCKRVYENIKEIVDRRFQGRETKEGIDVWETEIVKRK